MKRIHGLPLMERIQRGSLQTADGCWIWQGAKNKRGYGQIRVGSRTEQAHRIAFQAFNGNIPEGAHICHTCDHPGCVNPSHLFAGTAADNMRDMTYKGRGRPCGGAISIAHPSAKLTAEQIAIIRTDSRSSCALARLFGVHWSTVCRVRNGQTHARLAP